jgi:hypothetical protein
MTFAIEIAMGVCPASAFLLVIVATTTIAKTRRLPLKPFGGRRRLLDLGWLRPAGNPTLTITIVFKPESNS